MNAPKTILITGASRGIGKLTAIELAERGHLVIAGMRDIAGRNAKVAEELGAIGNIFPISLDVTNQQEVNDAIATIESERPVDVLINNAGVMPVGLTEGYTIEQAEALFDVNVYGVMRLTRAVLPSMRKRRSGLVIGISSAAGRFGMPFFGLYCSSKWAMEAYSEALHYELEEFGIESILVEPSGHGTDLVETAPTPDDQARTNEYGGLAAGSERLLNMFKSMFADDTDGTNPANVAVKIADLVEQNAPRPVRTAVGHDMGVEGLNAASEPFQAQLINMLKPVYSGEMIDA